MSSQTDFVPLHICVLTVSDTRNRETDTSGQRLQDLLQEAGHQLHQRELVKDDIYQIRAVISNWIVPAQPPGSASSKTNSTAVTVPAISSNKSNCDSHPRSD